MLTPGDDYPLHQTPEPIAFAGTDRNFYDRYFFNGYHAGSDTFFAAAFGVYPQLDIVDGSFCLSIGGVQHNVRASMRAGGDRLRLAVGPIAITIEEPLRRLRLSVADQGSGISADLIFTGRHVPIEEPRFMRRIGTRAFMDYTRMTQNGHWAGSITHGGGTIALDDGWAGTRDRSWGVRPVGAADSQPPAQGALAQFFWLWTPVNFADRSIFFHSNDDAAGLPWNRRAVMIADGGEAQEFEQPEFTLHWQPGTRRVRQLEVRLDSSLRLTLEPDQSPFVMSGLGYTHPVWGHGFDHGAEPAAAHDSLDRAEPGGPDPLRMHVQAPSRAVLHGAGSPIEGRAALEQLFIGPHAATGLSGLLDPAQ